MDRQRAIPIIEDEQFLMDLYKKVFLQRGFNVLEAGDGLAGLEKLNSALVDMVLLDIMLPKMDGISVLRKLKGENSLAKEVPVFMLTNLGQESVIKEALKIGADGYILKSKYLPDQVADEIEKFLREKEEAKTQSS